MCVLIIVCITVCVCVNLCVRASSKGQALDEGRFKVGCFFFFLVGSRWFPLLSFVFCYNKLERHLDLIAISFGLVET